MANDVYTIDIIVTGTTTITITDDGTGSDWLEIIGAWPLISDIRLSWFSESGTSTQASGLYWSAPGISHRLVVNGLIENVQGGDGADFIQSNEVGNHLIGDQGPDGGDDVIWAGAGNDILEGRGGNDELAGGDGDDSIFGGTGDDVINGNSGDDLIEGGAGADDLSGGGDAGDTVSYRASAAGVIVSLTFGAATTGQGGDAEGDTIRGLRHIDGSEFRDVLTDTVVGTVAFGGNDNTFRGFGGRDLLWLGGGNDRGYGGDDHDTIWGEDGDDMAWGGAGNDTLNMGNGNDVARGGDGRDVLRGDNGNDRLFGDAGDDIIFTGKGRDRAEGGDGNDSIMANGGTNAAFGQAGDDTLISTGGRNTFTGGAGTDRFEFRVQSADLDDGGFTRITDFQRARGEQVDLRVFGDFAFIRGQAFSGTGLEVRFETSANGVTVYADTNGDGSADVQIMMDGLARVFASDFLLV